MLSSFLVLAARSPTRQSSFRSIVTAHLGLLLASVLAIDVLPGQPFPLLGHLLLCAGIVEGALLIGWRLTQMPKSQALEFLLVSPLRPHRLLLNEVLTGSALLALVTLSGLPILAYLSAVGIVTPWDIGPLLLMPFSWGLLTGLGLTCFAYEPLIVRRGAELATLLLILFYLVVGILAGENLGHWLDVLPGDLKAGFLRGFFGFHLYNPFAVLRFWLEHGPAAAWDRFVWLETGLVLVLLVLAGRAAYRLQGHFHERHYQPARDVSGETRRPVGERPLSWWAVKRVSEYSGRINLWLAGGFGLLYAVYTVAGPYWPAWLGKRVFELCDGAGGIAGIATGLVLLSAVPAAFQYGLWDSNVQNRCRRLELLLLTELSPLDYWHAAASAAWKRGRGYFAVALLLWIAASVGTTRTAAGMSPWQVGGAVLAGLLLWAFYFTLGFRAFARGAQANGLGMLLTVGVPLLVYALYRLKLPLLAQFLPPGLVFGSAVHGVPNLCWLLLSALLLASATLFLAWRSLAHCDRDLRRWYDLNQGQWRDEG